jgi:hypothetical protein
MLKRDLEMNFAPAHGACSTMEPEANRRNGRMPANVVIGRTPSWPDLASKPAWIDLGAHQADASTRPGCFVLKIPNKSNTSDSVRSCGLG